MDLAYWVIERTDKNTDDRENLQNVPAARQSEVPPCADGLHVNAHVSWTVLVKSWRY